jgi:hypothetical protein
VLHLSATVSPSQDAAFMLGIGWTTFNLVMSGFFILYKVCWQHITMILLWLLVSTGSVYSCAHMSQRHCSTAPPAQLTSAMSASNSSTSACRLPTFIDSCLVYTCTHSTALAGDPLWCALQPALPVSPALRVRRHGADRAGWQAV